MGIVIAVIVAVLIIGLVVVLNRGRTGAGASRRMSVEPPDKAGPPVKDFEVTDGSARVVFDVPLPAGETDQVLADLLIREAVEVVREKRHSLPLHDVHQVIAIAMRSGEPVEVGRIDLDTPGQLPPPMRPELLPHLSQPGFDAFDQLSDLPTQRPGLASQSETEMLESISSGVRLSREVEAGLRAQGLDPVHTDACDLVLGVMRLAGYIINERSADTLDATKGGQRIFIRTVCHLSTDHPELDERQVDRFVVDFVSSGADQGLCITEKFSPFEVYDREKREPRMRFITRERLQDFVDALTLS